MFKISWVAVAVGASSLWWTPTSHADVSLKLEPGIAIPLSAPQSNLYDVGGGQEVKLLFGISPYVDIGPTTSFVLLPSATSGGESGVVWGFGGGVRIKRPHNRTTSGTSPWIDADLLYMRTGPLNRFGFDVGAGVAFPLDLDRSLWLGPFVRYQQTVNTARDGHDTRDAKILLAGLSIEFGSGAKRAPAVAPPPVTIVRVEPAPPPEVVVQEVVSCPDRDGDTIPDTIDRCPDVTGPIEFAGCPAYANVIISKDRLELKEKLFFAWDRAELKPASFPLLDDVVKALTDNPTFHVQIEGHTDSSGAAAHNQDLSERRAGAVRDYLTTHGIAADRLVARGFGPSVPLQPNTTTQGREKNRRVEFLVPSLVPRTPAAGSTK